MSRRDSPLAPDDAEYRKFGDFCFGMGAGLLLASIVGGLILLAARWLR